MTVDDNRQSATPQITVVLVTATRFASLRRTLQHLRAQTIANRIEIIIIGPSTETLNEHVSDDTAAFNNVKLVPIAPINNVDKAAGHAVPLASAPIIAIVEDHAYPQPEWAAALVQAHQGPYAVVGSCMVNANPRSPLSWVNLLIAYGPWMHPGKDGERATLPGHNISYKRDALIEFGDQLVDMLGRDGGLLEALVAQGGRFYLPSEALIAHANPSRLAPTVKLRFNAGRLYGAQRAQGERWSITKRLLYGIGGILIPFVRLLRLRAELQHVIDHHSLAPSVYPALFFGLLLDGLGQIAGYLAGFGNSKAILSVFEMDRIQHLNDFDKSLLTGEL